MVPEFRVVAGIVSAAGDGGNVPVKIGKIDAVIVIKAEFGMGLSFAGVPHGILSIFDQKDTGGGGRKFGGFDPERFAVIDHQHRIGGHTGFAALAVITPLLGGG